MTKFAKGDLVRVLASKFHGDEENVDELGMKYSERQLHVGKGAWCYGKISVVFKRSRACHRNTRSSIMREGQWTV
jgi:hypothetical protein